MTRKIHTSLLLFFILLGLSIEIPHIIKQEKAIRASKEKNFVAVKKTSESNSINIYRQDGKLLSTTYYSNSKRHGTFIEYHKNGEIRLLANYINGWKKGDQFLYNNQGELIRKFFY
ncbi:MAG: toxin-antitoxin system YwqK family antitoxin [Hyphomicrobiales bacterium]